jgi:hypothetical protein
MSASGDLRHAAFPKAEVTIKALPIAASIVDVHTVRTAPEPTAARWAISKRGAGWQAVSPMGRSYRGFPSWDCALELVCSVLTLQATLSARRQPRHLRAVSPLGAGGAAG